jgi:hypothetical protein
MPAAAMAIALALTLVATGAALAQDRDVVLRAEFPVDLAAPPSLSPFTGVIDPAYVARVPDGEAAAAVLAEATWVFSGMVWGFDYVYTPSDKARSIAELFVIQPRSPGALRQSSLHVAAARLDGTTLFATVEFCLDAAARPEIESWKSVSAATQGRGMAPAFQGKPGSVAQAQVEARREAVGAAAREALRAWLRGVTHNKPREVRGAFAFASPPRLVIREGSWVASVRLYARVDEIVSYGAY